MDKLKLKSSQGEIFEVDPEEICRESPFCAVRRHTGR